MRETPKTKFIRNVCEISARFRDAYCVCARVECSAHPHTARAEEDEHRSESCESKENNVSSILLQIDFETGADVDSLVPFDRSPHCKREREHVST